MECDKGFFDSSRGDSEGKFTASFHWEIRKYMCFERWSTSPCFLYSYRSCVMYNWGDSHRRQLVHGFKWSLQHPLFTWSQWSFRLGFEELSFQIWEDEKHMEAPNTNWQTIQISNFLEWQSHAAVWDSLRLFHVSKMIWNPKTLLAQLCQQSNHQLDEKEWCAVDKSPSWSQQNLSLLVHTLYIDML